MALIYLPGLGALSLTQAFNLAMCEPSTTLRKLVLVIGAGCGFRGRAQGTKQLSGEAKKPADRIT